MYYPILRSRQFELLALRELADQNLLSDRVCPVIEPVKASTSLAKTLRLFNQKGLPICLILNPQYGSLLSDIYQIQKEEFTEEFSKTLMLDTTKLVYRLDPAMFTKNLLVSLDLNNNTKEIDYLLIESQHALQDNNLEIDKYKFVMHPDERAFFRNRSWQHHIAVQDVFVIQARNADYAKKSDEPFSDWHNYYKKYEFYAFSDYTIVGNAYSEAGFAPRAVTIHLVYPDADNNLRIRHFVSDTNDKIADPAGKFEEALEKIIESPEITNTQTLAIKELLNYHALKKYPGLGTVKKLGIMHHLELVDRFLLTGTFNARL